MMAKGEELTHLRSGNSMRFGLGLPKKQFRKRLVWECILIPRCCYIEPKKGNEISIGNLIFQLENLPNDAYQIALAWGLDSQPIRTPEDDLLDATRTAMNSGEDWTVGCSTVRNNG